MPLYHWIRQWSAPEHQTMWVEVQAIATILAFVAAGWYAWIARKQARAIADSNDISRKLLAVEQTPVLIIEGTDEAARNIGRGPAMAAFLCSVKEVTTIGVVLPGHEVVFSHRGTLGLSDGK